MQYPAATGFEVALWRVSIYFSTHNILTNTLIVKVLTVLLTSLPCQHHVHS